MAINGDNRPGSDNPRCRATLLGDVVGSRGFDDQRSLLGALESALDRVNCWVSSEQPLTVTVGDELQAVYADLPSALRAVLILRLETDGRLDLRFGLGFGSIDILDPARTPFAQSGDGWWNARSAIDEVQRTRRGWPTGRRAWFVSGDRHRDALVNALLICQDQILFRLDQKDRAIALGLFLGKRQADLAEELAITQSTVSARQRNNGPNALLRAHQSLADLLEPP